MGIVFPGLQAQGADCDLSFGTTEGCAPQSIAFSPEYDEDELEIESIQWDFGDGSSSSQQNPTHVYSSPGTYRPEVTIEFRDEGECVAEADESILIYDSPEADFEFPGDRRQCINNNKFCFEDQSSPGEDEAPIERWTWEFDDGDTARSANPCKTYAFTGEYSVSLEVADTNGCTDIRELDEPVKVVGPALNVNFSYSNESKCPDPEIEISNRTDTSDHDIASFVWDFGDGNIDSSETLWGEFKYQYTEEGEFTPTLYVEAENGCSGEFSAPPVLNEYRNLEPEVVSPYEQCLNDNEVVLEHEPIDGASAEWAFPVHYEGFPGWDSEWEGVFNYEAPGQFDATLTVEKGNCEWVTDVCNVITVTGPMAQMDDPREFAPHDTIPPEPFGKEEFPETETCGEIEQEIPTVYTTLDTVIEENAKPQFDFCYADTINSEEPDLSIGDCPSIDGLAFELAPSDTKWVNDTVYEAAPRLYEPGDSIPEDPFRLGRGEYTPGVMHDTNLVKPECGEPNYVQFENHSLKFRGRHALDDSAHTFPDTCNRSGPSGASDSLLYFWDFDNDDAPSCTSTTENPDILCNYSTQKEPLHLYEEEGCFEPELTVTDTVTGCASTTETLITNQTPDAGWDEQFDNMTRAKQEANPLERTGVRLRGERCFGPNYPQDLDLNQILPRPFDCDPDTIWHVFDSTKAAQKEKVCSDTLTDQSGQDSIVTDSQVSHVWVPNYALEDQNWEYRTGGCKTMGAVVQSGDCLDTAWYNDYICFPEQDARFSILNDEEGEFDCPLSSPYGSGTNKRFCTGEELRLQLDYPDQDSLKRYTYTFENLHSGEIVGRDTLPYSQVSPDTSADGHHVVELTLEEPGKYLITGTAEHYTGCELPFSKKVNVGLHTDIEPLNDTEICAGDSVEFSHEVNHFNSFCPFRDIPLLTQRDFWSESGRPEEVWWDLNGDGDIDHVGPNPTYTYESMGTYDVELFAVDSVGCTTSVLKEDFIQVSDVQADFKLDEESERFNHCAPRFIGFEEDSEFIGPEIGNHTIESYEWEFGEGRPNSVLENPTHVYANNGAYDVTLSVESSFGCTDTVKKDSFVVIEGPQPRFEIASDTSGCVPTTITVRDLSEDADNRLWQLGDGSVVSSGPEDSLVELTYDEPGIYELTMTGTDSVSVPGEGTRFCEDTWPDDENPDHPTFTIRVFPQDEISVNYDEDVCVGEKVFIENNSEGYDNFTWIGAHDTLHEEEPTLSFDSTGIYEYILQGDGARCPEEDDTLNIEVHDVKGDFEIEENQDFPGKFTFEPTSPRFGGFQWFFGVDRDRKTASGPDPVEYQFDEPGGHPVCMEVISPEQCRDTVCKDVEVRTGIQVPNVFSPTDDGYNDEFYVDILGETHFELEIYNRWGRRVFKTDDPDEPWIGKVDNTGEKCEAGTYYYIVTYQHLGGVEQQKEGTVNLFR